MSSSLIQIVHVALLILVSLIPTTRAMSQDTFVPYQAGEVPDNVTDLWKDYDPRKEDLEVKVIREWKEEDVTTRYLTFKVGTFKGADARVAAYYCFPNNGQKNPAFVWNHGGGQRADRQRGVYFAKQGFASVDINWLGRELEPDIEENTDWGKVDPTQGPKFYPKALRQGWNRGVKPDAYSIDPVPSPRNNNWFLLVVSARRGITFLEQQPEVDADRIGLSGFSMGGTITAMTAIDPRVKAAVPFVGGTGYLHVDFPGVPGTSLKAHYPDHLEMYAKTVDPAAYWPLVNCPVMFISSSGDFHSAFDRIYQSMALLKHKAWRVTANMHENHQPGPEQWVLLNKWFNLHLKRIPQRIPITPPSELIINGREATFSVTPENRNHELLETEIYYSYDPNAITRFWIRAEAIPGDGGKSWSATLTLHEKLPLYVFALCRYSLGETVPLASSAPGEGASTLSLTSVEQSIVPENIDLTALAQLANTDTLEDFTHGFHDWAVRSGGEEIATYKFQSPYLERGNDRKLLVSLDPQGRELTLRLRAESRFLGRGRDLGTFRWSRTIGGPGRQEVMIDRREFQGDTDKPLEWRGISRLFLSIFDASTKTRIDLTSEEAAGILPSMRLVTVDDPS